MHAIQPYLDYFAQHPEWAIAVIFLIAFGEALLIIGLFVPSTAVLVGAGMLVGTGHLRFWPVFAATVIGAVAGDQLSYWAGRLFGERLKTLWPLNRYPTLVERGENFVREHGGKSVAIGRFVPGVKAVVPGIVGMLGMGQVSFATVNVSSGILWTAAHIFPGMLAGQMLAFAGELSDRLLMVLLVLILLLLVTGWIIRLIVGSLGPYVEILQRAISDWALARRWWWWRRFGRAISPRNPRSVMILVFAAVAITGLLALVRLTVGFVAQSGFVNMDLSVHNMMQELRNAPADQMMVAITMLGDGIVMIALTVAMILWLIWRRAWRAAISVAVTVVAARIFVPVLKIWLQRPRPEELTGLTEAFSFPSGHTTYATVTFGVLAVLASRSLGRWGQALVYSACGIAVIAIAYSRIYLGAHWLSDVLAGLLFGAVMTAAFGIAIETIPPRRIMPVGLTAAAMVAYLATGIVHIDRSFALNLDRYAEQTPVIQYDLAQWQDGGWASLPRQRIDLRGRSEEPFIVQWAGDTSQLVTALKQHGWKESEPWEWPQALLYLDPQRPLDQLPPRPALHEGRQAELTFTKDVPDSRNERLVLRVWRTSYQVADGGVVQRINTVSLTRDWLRKAWSLYAIPSALPARSVEVDEVRAALRAASGIKIIAGAGTEPPRQTLILAGQ
jgi:undecaprenyl-diphosphatase